MTDLTSRESELVALGAALASNCMPCIEHHIPKARKAGLTDREIHAAIQLADNIRQVPARNVLNAALGLLPLTEGNPSSAGQDAGCSCDIGSIGNAQGSEKGGPTQTMDAMSAMMSKMISSCGQFAAADGDKRSTTGEAEIPSAPGEPEPR